MATAELTLAAPAPQAVAAPPAPWPASALCWALVAALAYAVLAHGSASFPAETHLQVGLLAIAALTCAATLYGPLRARAPALAWSGAALLAGFAAWSGITVLWSVAPDRTWIELNRALAYALVVVLGIVAGASHPRALPRIAVGYLGVSVLAALYALGGKIAPGVHISGVVDFDQTNVLSRLRVPLDYWNALALVCVTAMPIALWLAADATRRLRVRLAGVAALWLLVVVLALTYSRGGFLALAAAALTVGVLSGARLRALLWLALAAAAAAPALAIAFTRPHLTGNLVPLGQRVHDGELLGAVSLGSLLALLAVSVGVVRLEGRVRWTPSRSRRVGYALLACVAAAAIVGIATTVRGPGGLSGAIKRERVALTQPRTDPITDPARLLSTNSGNRWVWWKEAGGSASDKPLGGWGAGSFAVVHLLYRDNQLPVNQPHSMPLQFLSETGVIGFLLACGGGLALLLAGLRYVRALARGGRERALGAAVLATGTAAAVQSTIDWNWEIPGATMPALMLLGVLGGAAAWRTGGRDGGSPAPTPDSEAAAGGPGTGAGRAFALAGAVVLGCLLAISSLLPELADSQARGALVNSSAGARTMRAALARAELAARLNPLSPDPLLAAAAIEQGLGDGVTARDQLLAAVRRAPYDVAAWTQLITAEVAQGDGVGAERAAQRAAELDPANPTAQLVAGRVAASVALPSLSATATGTPLPAAVAATPPPGTGAAAGAGAGAGAPPTAGSGTAPPTAGSGTAPVPGD